MLTLGEIKFVLASDLGTVVIKADPGMAESLKNKWKTHKGVDFKEGAKVLRMALAMQRAGLRKDGKDWLSGHANEEWRVTKQGYYGSAPPGVQSMIPKY